MGFDFDNNMPIYLQISDILKVKIISGEYMPGQRLPSVRDLALALKANPNTVQRALANLENDGLIFTERTNGKFVTENIADIAEQKNKYADSLAREYLSNMKKIGFDEQYARHHLENTGGNTDGTN